MRIDTFSTPSIGPSTGKIGTEEALSRLPQALEDKSTEGPSFKEMLGNSINEVNQLLQSADKASTDIATGRSENLHDAMIAFEKAESAMKFLVQARNKAIDAYQEIMHMQV